MARPPMEIDMEKLEAFMRLMPTLEDTAAYFKCSADTIERRIREHSDLTFREFREQHMVHTRMKLIRTALQEADSGNSTMLIFCLKNLCAWSDKRPGEDDHTVNLKGEIEVGVKRIDIAERVKQLKGES